MKPLIALLPLVLLLHVRYVAAQDCHFSQPFDVPMLYNPAASGFLDGTYQMGGMYRSQWQTLTDPFKSLGAYLNTAFPSGKNKNHFAGLAFSGIADKAGQLNYTTSMFSLTGSYHYNFGNAFQHYVGAGVAVGAGNTTLDLAAMVTDEQHLTGSTSEVIGFEKANFGDLSFGLAYHLLSDTSHLSAGLAVFHLNRPKLSYSDDGRSHIYSKYVLTLAYSYPLLQNLELTPAALAAFQGPSRELLAGLRLRYMLTSVLDEGYALSGSLYLRYGNALIPAVAIDMQELRIGLSYDLMLGKLARSDSRQGAMELTVSYRGRMKGISSGRIYNPRF